ATFTPYEQITHRAQTRQEWIVSALSRFLGDSPWRVVIKLLLISLIVGYIMHMFDWTPWDIYYGIRDAVMDIWHAGFDALGRFDGYILIGAMVVVPIFLLARVLSFRRN